MGGGGGDPYNYVDYLVDSTACLPRTVDAGIRVVYCLVAVASLHEVCTICEASLWADPLDTIPAVCCWFSFEIFCNSDLAAWHNASNDSPEALSLCCSCMLVATSTVDLSSCCKYTAVHVTLLHVNSFSICKPKKHYYNVIKIIMYESIATVKLLHHCRMSEIIGALQVHYWHLCRMYLQQNGIRYNNVWKEN